VGNKGKIDLLRTKQTFGTRSSDQRAKEKAKGKRRKQKRFRFTMGQKRAGKKWERNWKGPRGEGDRPVDLCWITIGMRGKKTTGGKEQPEPDGGIALVRKCSTQKLEREQTFNKKANSSGIGHLKEEKSN